MPGGQSLAIPSLIIILRSSGYVSVEKVIIQMVDSDPATSDGGRPLQWIALTWISGVRGMSPE